MSHRRRKHRDRVSHDRWLVSYADFITLLFAFFVVMYSTAVVDKKKVGQMAVAIQSAFQQMGAFPPAGSANPETLKFSPAVPSPPLSAEENSDIANLQKELRQLLADEIAKGEVAVREGPDGLVISLREAGFFDSGSAGVKNGSETAVSHIAGLLARRPFRIRIEGHTDNIPIRTTQYPSNWELSTARATELVRLLIMRYGFAPESLSAAGFAEYHPIASNETPEGQAQNRRVDIVILGEQRAPGSPPSATEHSAKPSAGVPNSGGPN